MKKFINQNTVIKYLLTGGLAFAVDYLVLLTGYYVFLLPLWVATTLGYLGGLFVSFFVNRIWVFGEHGKRRKIARQLVEYVLLLLFNYMFTVFTVQLLDNLGVTPAISKIVVTAMIAGWNYLIYNKVIFTHDKGNLAP